VEDGRLVAAAQNYARFVLLSSWQSTHPGLLQVHCDADCRNMYGRAVQAGYPPACTGENVMLGTGQMAAEDMWNILMNGPHEDAANALFRYSGVACYAREDHSEFVCVQLLAAEGGTPCSQ
jgi:hypothetical protein